MLAPQRVIQTLLPPCESCAQQVSLSGIIHYGPSQLLINLHQPGGSPDNQETNTTRTGAVAAEEPLLILGGGHDGKNHWGHPERVDTGQRKHASIPPERSGSVVTNACESIGSRILSVGYRDSKQNPQGVGRLYRWRRFRQSCCARIKTRLGLLGIPEPIKSQNQKVPALIGSLGPFSNVPSSSLW